MAGVRLNKRQRRKWRAWARECFERAAALLPGEDAEQLRRRGERLARIANPLKSKRRRKKRNALKSATHL
jgi:hypothetical protein